MNALLIAAAVVCQWDMTPQPSKWNMSPKVEARLLDPVPVKQPTPQKNQGYPLRNGSRYWVYYPNDSRPYHASVNHMETGDHAGEFDPDWLRTLNQEDLNWLHSHHHAGIVDWSYAKRPGEFTKPQTVTSAKPAKKMKLVRQQYCNGRQCWYQDVWVEDNS